MNQTFPEYNEVMGDALEEVREAFGKEYDLSLELECRLCGSYGHCDCEVLDLERF
jgi:hypothetical protein